MDTNQSFLATNVVNIFDALDDGVYVTDKEGVTLHVNAMYEKLTGLMAEDLKGQNVRALREKGVFDVVLNPTIVKTRKPATDVQTLQDGKRVALRGFPVFDDKNELVLVVTLVRDVTLMEQMRAQIFQQKKLLSVYERRLKYLSARVTESRDSYDIPLIKELSERIGEVAAKDSPILLLGETGVGKGRLARLAHERSRRKNEIFVEFDCRDIPRNRVEHELFGYVPEPPDAFTSSDSEEEPGLFESADKGTVFLKKINEMPLAMQPKILRLLQDGEVIPAGLPVPRKVDVRIVASCDGSLLDSVQNGKFREDLRERLREEVVDIRPLRETPEIIPETVNHFLKLYGKKYKKDIACPDETMSLFSAYKWPGNISELENTMQNLVFCCEAKEILPKDLPPSIQAGSQA